MRLFNSLKSLIVLAGVAPVLCAAPNVGTLNVNPPQLGVGISTSITVSAAIPDTTLIIGSVNLQRISSTGSVTVLGALYDDGTHGDVIAGDRRFTGRMTLQENAPGVVQLRVSAAFQGKVMRLFSPVVEIPVYDGQVMPITLTGRVQYDSGQPITGAVVTGGLGTQPAASPGVTDSSGNFTITVGTRVLPVQMLVQAMTATTPALTASRWSSVSGNPFNVGTLVIPNPQGAQVPLTGGTGQTADGSVRISGLPPAVTQLYARSYDPSTTPDAFPGDFTENGRIALKSAVFVWAAALDAQGRPVHNLSQAVTLKARVPRSQWPDLEDIRPGTDRIDLPMYVYDELSQTWIQEGVGWIEDASGTILPEDAQSVILNGSWSGDLFAVMSTNHFSWINVDYPYIGPWTLSHLPTDRRNNDCLFKAGVLARTIFRTSWANTAYQPMNKPNLNLNTEVPDRSSSEFEASALSDSTYGQTTAADFKDLIHLNEKLWDKCDQKKNETIFIMAVTMLHETAHWKHDVKKYDGVYTDEGDVGGEAGLELEKKLFGDTINGTMPVSDLRHGETPIGQDQLNKLSDPQWWTNNANNFNDAFWQNLWSPASPAQLRSMAAAQPPLKITISQSQSAFPIGSAIPVTVQLENTGAQPIQILGLMRMEGYPLFFRITDASGNKVPFRGPKEKIGYSSRDYILLNPGQSYQTVVDLTRDAVRNLPNYHFTHTGIYSATAVYAGYFGLPETSSNTITFTITGGGKLAGRIGDAVTGSGVAGASIRVLQRTTEISATTANASGIYSVADIPAGSYTVEVTAPGYLHTAQPNIVIAIGQTTTLNVNLSQLLVRGEMRIVLSWGSSPSDLDSHLWLPPAEPYHIAYDRRGATGSCPFAVLDRDVTSGFGPETVTIAQRYNNGDYIYSVYQYSSGESLTTSGAKVQVFDSTGLVATFNVPTIGNGRWWNVMKVSGLTGAITEINQLGADPSPYPDTGLCAQ